MCNFLARVFAALAAVLLAATPAQAVVPIDDFSSVDASFASLVTAGSAATVPENIEPWAGIPPFNTQIYLINALGSPGAVVVNVSTGVLTFASVEDAEFSLRWFPKSPVTSVDLSAERALQLDFLHNAKSFDLEVRIDLVSAVQVNVPADAGPFSVTVPFSGFAAPVPDFARIQLIEARFLVPPSTAFALTSVAAVPEPGTYAMLLAGLGLIGWVVQRRAGVTASLPARARERQPTSCAAARGDGLRHS